MDYSTEINTLKQKLDEMRKLYAADGKITPEEQKDLDELAAQLSEADGLLKQGKSGTKSTSTKTVERSSIAPPQLTSGFNLLAEANHVYPFIIVEKNGIFPNIEIASARIKIRFAAYRKTIGSNSNTIILIDKVELDADQALHTVVSPSITVNYSLTGDNNVICECSATLVVTAGKDLKQEATTSAELSASATSNIGATVPVYGVDVEAGANAGLESSLSQQLVVSSSAPSGSSVSYTYGFKITNTSGAPKVDIVAPSIGRTQMIAQALDKIYGRFEFGQYDIEHTHPNFNQVNSAWRELYAEN